jgi:hypothetical protein
MASAKYLKVTLTLMALYAGIMGSLTLFFQDAGSFIFRYNITDPVITRFWGGILIAIAIFYLFLSMDPVKYRLFIWVGVFDLGIAMIASVYSMYMKELSVSQGLISIILNPVFMIILLYGLAKKSEGEIILVSGQPSTAPPEQTLPAHLAGEHRK